MFEEEKKPLNCSYCNSIKPVDLTVKEIKKRSILCPCCNHLTEVIIKSEDWECICCGFDLKNMCGNKVFKGSNLLTEYYSILDEEVINGK